MSPKHAGTAVWELIQDHINTYAVDTFNKAFSSVP